MASSCDDCCRPREFSEYVCIVAIVARELPLGVVVSNYTSLTCSGGTGANPVENSTDIILSGGYSTSTVLHYLTVIHVPGVPDPVSGLDYDDTVVIESSVTLQWTRPSYTGGASLMNYSVSANGQTWPVSDEKELVSYTTSGLVYGEVQVTAINSCDQQSLTTSINIPAEGELFNN